MLQRGTRTVRPLCVLLGIDDPRSAYSPGLQQALVDFGAEHSFEKAALLLSRHHPVNLSGKTINKITCEHGRRMLAQQARTRSVGALPGRGPEHIVAETDGSMLPIVSFKQGQGDKRKRRQCEWKEAKLCAARAHRSTRTQYGCSFDGPEATGYIWAHCVKEAGWASATHIHVVSDGAPWIALQTQQQFGKSATQLIDFYHLSEYLAKAGKQAAFAHWPNWLQDQQERMLEGKLSQVLDELRPHQEPEDQKETPVRDAVRYIESRSECFDYPCAIRQDLPIGSGLIEGSHRHVLQERLKVSGAWWTLDNAAAIAALRVHRANQHWDLYWRKLAA